MKFISTLFTILIFSFSGIAQQNILTQDYQISFDDISVSSYEIEIDSNLIKKLDQTFEDAAKESGIKGVSCVFNFSNDEIWQGVYGENTKDVLITKDNSFAIGSVSKSITATCILKLVEENLVALDDTIGQWIATNPNIDPTVTIRQCLNHTSGIADILKSQTFLLDAFLDPSKIWDPKDVIAKYVPTPLFEKGSSWEYSNSNYIIAGLIIEGVTGKAYDEVVREKVLDPLGLTNIQLFPQEAINTDFVSLWNDLLNGKPLDGLFSGAWAAGAYVSTPTDISIWMKKLAKGEVLTEASMAQMLDLIVRSDNSGYGLGITKLETNNLTLFGHNGDISYKSSVYYIEELEMSVAIHTNDGSETGNQIRPILEKLLKAYTGYLTNNENIEKESNFSMYPNPVSNMISVDMKNNGVYHVSILNTLGQTVSKFNGSTPHFEIPVYQLNNGQYILMIESENKVGTSLFIKQ